MNHTFFIFVCLILSVAGRAQEAPLIPKVILKWAPTGLTVGSISLQGEYNLGRSGLTAKIGIPANTDHMFQYDGNDAAFSMKATSFLAGYRTYFSKSRRLRGLYFEPYFKYVHHTAEGTGKGSMGNKQVVLNFSNDYNGFGLGAQLGAQFIIKKRFVIDLFFLGPEINTAQNHFKAVETSNAIPWTKEEATEAEQDIRNFLDKFPFLRNHTDVMVDQSNKTVNADFKGALPGFRAGISFGLAL